MFRQSVLMFLVVLLVLGAGAVGLAVELTQLHKQKGYTVKVPDGWVAIPRQVLDEREKLMSEMTGGKIRDHFDCGFQLRAEEWFEGPVILVMRMRTGRIPPRELKNFDRRAFRKGAQDEIDRAAEAMPFAAELELGKTVYDPEALILWTTLIMDMQDVGTIKQLIGMRLTEDGFIGVYGMAEQASFDKYSVLFEKIVRGVEIDERLRYKPRGMGVHGAADLAVKIGLYALIAAGIVWLVRRHWRKRRADWETP